jgi:uncharacterized membrane protein
VTKWCKHGLVFDTVQWVIRIALALVFVFMGTLHFVPGPARTMAAMIPPAFTRRVSATALVAFTGVCELAGGIGLLVPTTQFAAGIALAVFLVVVFPANALAARDPERFGRAAIGFWPRLVGQVVLIGLCVVAAL